MNKRGRRVHGQSHRLADLVDLERLRHVCDGLAAASGMVLAVLDPDGTILMASGWQDICTQFHRLNDETARDCLASDTTMTRRLSEGVDAGDYHAYKCANGLWDVAFPLIIEGEHLASVFTGQFFYDDDVVDTAAFRERARRLGFDEATYLEALARVPVYSHQRVADTITFLGDFVGMLADLGLSALQRGQERAALQESEERYRQLFEAESDAVFLIDNETGGILEANSAAAAMYGYSQDELLTMTNEQLSAEPEETQAVTHGTPVVAESVVTIPLRIHRKKDRAFLPAPRPGRAHGGHPRCLSAKGH
jgi:PAS domain-containing protein